MILKNYTPARTEKKSTMTMKAFVIVMKSNSTNVQWIFNFGVES